MRNSCVCLVVTIRHRSSWPLTSWPMTAATAALADSVFKDTPSHAASMAVDGKLDTFWAAGVRRLRFAFSVAADAHTHKMK